MLENSLNRGVEIYIGMICCMEIFFDILFLCNTAPGHKVRKRIWVGFF